MDTLFPLIVLIQTVLLVFAGMWFFWRNDELPLVIAGLTMFFSSYRYFAVTQGWGEWVETVYTFGLPPITDEDALEVLPLITLGEFVLMATYCARMRQKLPVILAEGLQRLPPRTISSLFLLSMVFFFLSEYARSAAFNLTSSSYVFLFPLTLVGVSTLLVAAWRFGALYTPFQKVVCVLIVAGAAYNNFSAFLRFQFVGLVVGIAVALSVFYVPRQRAIALLLGTLVAVLAFSLGGAFILGQGRRPHIVAFEPGIGDTPSLAEQLISPARLWAVSYAGATFEFLPSYVGAKNDGVTMTLDAALEARPALAGRPALVKVDVEGAEVEVLEGARQLLAAPVQWLVEVHGEHLLEPVLSRLQAAGRTVNVHPLRPHWLFGPEARTIPTCWVTTCLPSPTLGSAPASS
ncbi:MAG: FkbM family methyltransferase [Acidobacteriota bacterium]